MNKPKIEENSKQFALGAILNITTGRMFTKMTDIYEVLNYLTGENLSTHQIPRVASIAKSYILSLYPALEGVGVDIDIHRAEDANTFIEEQKKIYGDKLPLKPMSKPDGYSYIDPIEELITNKSKRR